MKKLFILLLLSLFVVISCGDDINVAEITVNGVEFTKSVDCSANSADSFSLSASDGDGKTIQLTQDSLVYTESGKNYIGDEDDGTFVGSYEGGIIKFTFDVTAKVGGLAVAGTKIVKGVAKCTPGGSKN